MSKVTSKLKNIPEEEKVVTVKEYPDVELPSEKKMKEWLTSQVKADGTFKFEGEVDTTTAISKSTNDATSEPPSQSKYTSPVYLDR